MKEESKIKCFKCGSDKLHAGFPRVTMNGKPQLEFICVGCGWDIAGIEVEWDTVQMFDIAEEYLQEVQDGKTTR